MPHTETTAEDAGSRTFTGSEYNKETPFLSTADTLERTP